MADINLLYPTLRVQLTSSSVGPILQSNGWRADGDIWACLHPYQMPRDMLGFRLRTPLSHGTSLQEVRWIKHHAKWWADQVSYRLRTEASTQSLLSLMTRAGASEYSKTGFLAAKLTCPGPPLDIFFDWIGLEVHRRAVSGLFVGDWFLAMYAGNFFAKDFIPRTPKHFDLVDSAGVLPERICLHCWHNHRICVLEDPVHVLTSCPRYSSERDAFILSLPADTRLSWQLCAGGGQRLELILSAKHQSTWAQFGRFCAGVLQSRRVLRRQFEARKLRLSKESYSIRKKTWLARGHWVCRHGVFFTNLAGPHCKCPCLSASNSEENTWKEAKFMPHLCPDLKALVVVPFNGKFLERLGVLQARSRKLWW